MAEVLAAQGHVVLCTSRPAGVDEARRNSMRGVSGVPFFRVTGEEIGLGVRSEVEGVMTNGEIIGVGELEEAGGRMVKAYRVAYKGGDQEDLWEGEGVEAKDGCVHVKSDGEVVKAKQVIGDPSYFPDRLVNLKNDRGLWAKFQSEF